MNESSAEYVLSTEDSPGMDPTPVISEQVAKLVRSRKWFFIIVSTCMAIAVGGILIPVIVGRNSRTHERSRRSSIIENTIIQTDPKEMMPTQHLHLTPRHPSKGKAKQQHAPDNPKRGKVSRFKNDNNVQPADAKQQNKATHTKKPEHSKTLITSTFAVTTDHDKKTPVAEKVEDNSEFPDETTEWDGEIRERVQTKPVKTRRARTGKELPLFTSEPAENTTLRLPRDLEPVNYSLFYDIFSLQGEFYFEGRSVILLNCLKPTKSITLHTSSLVIDKRNLTFKGYLGITAPNIISITVSEDVQRMTILLSENLSLGQKYILTVPFRSIAYYENAFNVRLIQDGNLTRIVAGTNFLPTDARRAFPCFDEPNFKAEFDLTITHPKDMHAISNMPLERTESLPLKRSKDVFKSSVKMSPYTFGFYLSNFTAVGNDTLHIWGQPSVIKEVDYVLELSWTIRSFYEDLFKVKYPVPKTDIIAVPHYLSDVQSLGLLYVQERVAVYNPEESSATKQQDVYQTLCHDFAHEWFGNLVTPEWWNHVWLSAGFSTYFQYRCIEYLESIPRMFDMMLVNEILPVMKQDALGFSPPVSFHVTRPSHIYDSFNEYSIQKAVGIIRMMEFMLPPGVFKTAITRLLQHRRFSYATPSNLWEELNSAQKEEDRTEMRSNLEPWILQTGFPLVTVTRIYGDNSATLRQEKFLLDPKENGTKSFWRIPISYTSGVERNFYNTSAKMWLTAEEAELENLPNDNHWVILNNRLGGYYKVNYDLKNWNLIIKQLNSNHTYIDPINRAQINSDLFDLARAGLINYTLALNATEYLKQEGDYIPWKVAFDNMKDIDFKLKVTETYNDWKQYTSSLIQRNFHRVDWSQSGKQSLYQSLFDREVVYWACYYEYKPCVQVSLELFQELRNDTEETDLVPAAFRQIVYCQVVKNEKEDAWDFLWNRYKSIAEDAEKTDIIHALGCSKNPKKIKYFLKAAVSSVSDISIEDGPAVLQAVANSFTARNVAFRFFKSHWKEIQKAYSKSTKNLLGITESFLKCVRTKQDADELKTFFARNNKSASIPEWRYQKVLQQRRIDEHWMENYYPVIKQWLSERIR